MVLPSLPAYPIRASVRAVIESQGAVLLSKFDDENGVHYNWPGGGMEFGENLHTALQREVLEETNASIQIGPLVCVYEHLISEEIAKTGMPQSLSLIFHCSLVENAIPSLPLIPDENQIDVEWIPVEELQHHQVLPDITEIVQQWHSRNEAGLHFVVNTEDT